MLSGKSRLVDLPKDVMAQKTNFHYPDNVELRSYNPVAEGDAKQIEKATELIMKAKRPVLYVGGGVIQGNAASELTALAEKLQWPVTTTLHGKRRQRLSDDSHRSDGHESFPC